MTSHFIWYELLTSDADAAQAFYGAVLGWRVSDSGQKGMDYRILSAEGVGIGGLMALPPSAAAAGMPPGWFGYVNVPDVDRSVAGIVAAGGASHMPVLEVPGVGRMVMFDDPQGASLYVMTPLGTGESAAFAPGKPGHVGWNELHAKDWKAAIGFYGAQFGWDTVHAMDMGKMGTYLQFNFGSGEMVGGMFDDREARRAHWLYYFTVDDIEAAATRVSANGGEITLSPHQVPTGDWIIQARDPQGARFALVGAKR